MRHRSQTSCPLAERLIFSSTQTLHHHSAELAPVQASLARWCTSVLYILDKGCCYLRFSKSHSTDQLTRTGFYLHFIILGIICFLSCKQPLPEVPHQTAGSAPGSSQAGWWHPLTFRNFFATICQDFDILAQTFWTDSQNIYPFGVGALTDCPNNTEAITQGWAPFLWLAQGDRHCKIFWRVVQQFLITIFDLFVSSGTCNIDLFWILLAWIVFGCLHSCWIRLPLSGALTISLQPDGRFTRPCWTNLETRQNPQVFAPVLPDSDPGGKPGPKSRRRRFVSFAWVITVLLFWMAGPVPFYIADRGEGCTPAMRSAEMSLPWPYLLNIPSDMKPHGMQPQMRSSAPIVQKPIPNRKVVKRSLHRAQKRASLHGMTWYRGQCMMPQDFLNMGMPALATPIQPNNAAAATTCHQQNKPKKRLMCMTWNGGGLASHRLYEVKQWLQIQHIQIAVIAETRWTFQSTWSDQSWHHIHSADPSHRGSGVLVLIAKSLCPESNLRWHEVIPGRLVHVRLMMPARNIDVLGCYQHVYTRDTTCKSKRESFWKALDHHLSMLPNRNTLVILGDMNCSLTESKGCCGSTCFRWQNQLHQGSFHADAGRFTSLLKLHGLVALNTWDPTTGPTFLQNGHARRIDYICTRAQFADGGAKSPKILWNAPFMPLTQTGHAPILGHLPLYWIPPDTQVNGLTPHQRQQGRLAQMTNTMTWQTFMNAAPDAIWNQLQTVLTSDCQELDTVHVTATHEFKKHFPAVSKTLSLAP